MLISTEFKAREVLKLLHTINQYLPLEESYEIHKNKMLKDK
jgi:hypothetical protein